MTDKKAQSAECLSRLTAELGMTSDEHFKHEYLCAFAVSEKEKTLHELAVRYHDVCEAYDRTVCTSGIKHGAIMPSNSRDMGMIGENAKNVLKKLLELEVAFNHGITKRELMKEISRIDR